MEGAFWKKGLCFVLVVCLTVTVARSQDALVNCFTQPAASGSGSGTSPSSGAPESSGINPMNCNGQPMSEGEEISYTECCTREDAASIRYILGDTEGPCTPCGPVINESSVIPFTIGPTTILLQWDLRPDSRLMVTDYVATYRLTIPMNEAEGGIFGSRYPPVATSVQNINLETERNYTFTIRADSNSNDGRSPTISVTWITGLSSVPVFVDFTIVSATQDSVTANFTLESSGVRPLLSYIVTWREDTEDDFPPENIIQRMFSDSEPVDGQIFTETFEDLVANTRYLVRISATNGAGTSTTDFAIDPEEVATVEVITFAVLPGTAVSSYKTSPILLIAATAASVFLLKKLL